MAKFLVQLLHLEDSHTWMVAKDHVDVGGEGGGEVGEARAEDEVIKLEVHHQGSLHPEANQVVPHREGEESEGTQTVAASLRTSRMSPLLRCKPTSSSILVMCTGCLMHPTVTPS